MKNQIKKQENDYNEYFTLFIRMSNIDNIIE